MVLTLKREKPKNEEYLGLIEEIRKAPVLHGKVIEVNEMEAAVKCFLGL